MGNLAPPNAGEGFVVVEKEEMKNFNLKNKLFFQSYGAAVRLTLPACSEERQLLL